MKCPFFKIWAVFLLFSCRSCLYILEVLCKLYISQIMPSLRFLYSYFQHCEQIFKNFDNIIIIIISQWFLGPVYESFCPNQYHPGYEGNLLCCHHSRPGRFMVFVQMEKYSRSRWDVWHVFIHGWVSHPCCKLCVYLHVSCHGPCSPVRHPLWHLSPCVSGKGDIISLSRESLPG